MIAALSADLTATTLGMPPIRPVSSTTPAPNAPPPPKPLAIAAPPPPLVVPSVPATREEAVAAALKFAQAVEARGAVLADETVKGLPPGIALSTETIRGTMPANALIAPPPPIQYPAADESDEKTDLTNIPMVPETRRTEIGVAVTPSDALVLPSAPARAPTDEETRPTTQMAAEEPTNPLDAGLLPVEQVDVRLVLRLPSGEQRTVIAPTATDANGITRIPLTFESGWVGMAQVEVIATRNDMEVHTSTSFRIWW